jgi:3-dehydroquinate dehydratase-1
MKPVVVRNVKIGEGTPKICVPIVGQTKDEILAVAKEVQYVPADLVEWRVDWFEGVTDVACVRSVLKELREELKELPILFTFRTKAEGGEKDVTFEEYEKLLQAVAATRLADMIDVEVFIDEKVMELVSSLQKEDMIVVGSYHNFHETPSKEEMIKRLCYMQEVGVDIPKLAVMPQTEEDVLRLLVATREMANVCAKGPIVTMTMAGVGAVSRISGEIFGSTITFGSLNQASAPGQIEVTALKKMLEILHHAQ